jgi:hypothetical protein
MAAHKVRRSVCEQSVYVHSLQNVPGFFWDNLRGVTLNIQEEGSKRETVLAWVACLQLPSLGGVTITTIRGKGKGDGCNTAYAGVTRTCWCGHLHACMHAFDRLYCRSIHQCSVCTICLCLSSCNKLTPKGVYFLMRMVDP